MERMFTAIDRFFQRWATDPAVALGLFGTGVGLALPEFAPGTGAGAARGEQRAPIARVR
jgi:hypothetical protein